MGRAETKAVGEVIQSGWIGLGPKTKEFEDKFAAYMGCKYAVDMNSATAALHLAMCVLDIEGGEAEFFTGADLSMVHKICVETHPDVLGDRVLSEMFAGLVAQGFALDFSLIRKNVFFFHRVA